MDCAYRGNPLACEADVVPSGPGQHRALHTPAEPVDCPACAAPLARRWCKAPYAGPDGDSDDLEAGGV